MCDGKSNGRRVVSAGNVRSPAATSAGPKTGAMQALWGIPRLEQAWTAEVACVTKGPSDRSAATGARRLETGGRSATLDRNLVQNDGEELNNELNQDPHAFVLHAVGPAPQIPLRDRAQRPRLRRRTLPALASTGKTAADIRKTPAADFGLKMSGELFRQADIGGACAQNSCSVRDVMNHDGAAIGRSPAARALAGRTSTASAANRASRFLQQVGTEADSPNTTTRGAGNRQTR